MKLSKPLNKMVSAVVSEFKQKIEDFCIDRADESLTPEIAALVSDGLHEALMSAGREGYRVYIESYDVKTSTIPVHDRTYRLKQVSAKNVLSVFGKIKINRGLYQHDRGGKAYIPLDAMWGMEGEYATAEVRESCLFTLSHVTAQETAAILKKCASFHPSATAIQNMAGKVGTFIEGHEEKISSSIRMEEEAPTETRSLVVSMDGVNLLLNEPGPRQGRPKERPFSASREEKTSYRNALVGSLSFYGEVPPKKHTPERIQSRYIAQMPQEKGITFKRRFEEEVRHAEGLLGPEITKVMLCDGARGIWNYVDSNPQFDEYEKLLDFYHASEHLSKAAEARISRWGGDIWQEILGSGKMVQFLVRQVDQGGGGGRSPDTFHRLPLQEAGSFEITRC